LAKLRSKHLSFVMRWLKKEGYHYQDVPSLGLIRLMKGDQICSVFRYAIVKPRNN
jgi:hypothetical protein